MSWTSQRSRDARRPAPGSRCKHPPGGGPRSGPGRQQPGWNGDSDVYPMGMTNIAIENGPLIMSFPMKHADFPYQVLWVYWRVCSLKQIAKQWLSNMLLFINKHSNCKIVHQEHVMIVTVFHADHPSGIPQGSWKAYIHEPSDLSL